MEDAGLGGDDEFGDLGVFHRIIEDSSRASDVMRQTQHRGLALGVREDVRARVARHQLDELPLRERLVDDARRLPQIHRATRLFHQPRAEVPVGREQDRTVDRQALDHALRVARCADDVGEGLRIGGTVDVRHDEVLRMGVLPGLQLGRGAPVRERAAGGQVGQDHDPLGIQDLCGLGHEVDPAEHDHVRLRVARGPGELEAVADKIREILNLRVLVIVREDDGVAFATQTLDLSVKIGAGRDRRAHWTLHCP